MRPQTPAAQQEWFFHPRIESCGHLAHLLLRRLRRAIGACGYPNGHRAAAYVGEECMAIAWRLYGGWAAICAVDEAKLRAIAFKLASHLWAVRTEGVTPLADSDRVRDVAMETTGRRLLSGKELMLTLARAVGNDGDLVPLSEAHGLKVDQEMAARTAQEMFSQWSQSPQTPKATFRRVLARRLQESCAGRLSGVFSP